MEFLLIFIGVWLLLEVLEAVWTWLTRPMVFEQREKTTKKGAAK